MLDSRGASDVVRRRRECLSCGRRFTTYERLAEPEVRVVKRGGREVQPFDRAKLDRVVERVTRGRPVGDKARRDLVRGLEAELIDSGVETVTSAQLAERLLAKLRELDALAAQRFASNYQQEDGTIRTSDEPPSPQLALPVIAPPASSAAPAADAAPATGRRRRRRGA